MQSSRSASIRWASLDKAERWLKLITQAALLGLNAIFITDLHQQFAFIQQGGQLAQGTRATGKILNQ